MMTRLLVARHGNTFGPGDVVTRVGTTDLPLVSKGLEQGRNLGMYLKNHHLIPDVIFTSKLQRTIQTAEQAQIAMQTNVAIQTLSIFNEIDYGIDENQPEEKVVARIGKAQLQAWESAAEVPSGWNVDPALIIKNWQSFAASLIKQHSGKIILLVTSNGIARFAPYLTGDFGAFRTRYGIKMATGAVSLFEHKPPTELWTCSFWNIKP